MGAPWRVKCSLKQQLGGRKNIEESVQTTACLACEEKKRALTEGRDKLIRDAEVSLQVSKISNPPRSVKVWSSQQALRVVQIYTSSSGDLELQYNAKALAHTQVTQLLCSYFQPQKGKSSSKSHVRTKNSIIIALMKAHNMLLLSIPLAERSGWMSVLENITFP